MAKVRFPFPQNAETVFKFVSDEAVVRRRSEVFGDRDINITRSGDTITNVRMVSADVPGFAKKFLNPVNQVTDIKRWNPATRSAQLSVDIKGAPVKVEGVISIKDTPTGSDYEVDFTVTCKIPLIGGQLEKHVIGVTEDGMRKEADWNRAELSKG